MVCSLYLYNQSLATGGCSADTEGNLQWPATAAGSQASLACPEGAQGTITRMCSAEGQWQPSVNNCGTICILYFLCSLFMSCWNR